MAELSIKQIRNFRLHSHYLDMEYSHSHIVRVVGACGMQNTPPGAWETALYNRVPRCSLSEMEHLLYKDKLLLQAWSFRGTPVVFPVCESDVFLSSLIPAGDESWIYTKGIGLALDSLQMTLDELFVSLKQVIPQLDDTILVSKTQLDQTLAQWMLPLLPVEKRGLWNQPSMYGNPDKQTVGGAVVSFLLRPCAYSGLVVFGERKGISPSFTSFKNWTGHALSAGDDAGRKIVRKYLHCYGPATVDTFVCWLGCSGQQGRRLWKSISEETEPVIVSGKKAFILSKDREQLFSPPSFQRELLLLGGHDPYLDQRDRLILQPDKSLHKKIWKLVSNPGVVVYQGEAIGIWTSKKKGKGIEIKVSLWNACNQQKKLRDLAERYTVFRQEKLIGIEIE